MSFHTAPQPQPSRPAVPVDGRRTTVRHPQADQVWVARAPTRVTDAGAICDQSPLVAWWPSVLERVQVQRRPTAPRRPTRAVASTAERRSPVAACLP